MMIIIMRVLIMMMRVFIGVKSCEWDDDAHASITTTVWSILMMTMTHTNSNAVRQNSALASITTTVLSILMMT